MDFYLFEKLQAKAKENEIYISRVEQYNMLEYILSYVDGEKDLNSNKLKQKVITVGALMSIDDVITLIKSKNTIKPQLIPEYKTSKTTNSEEKEVPTSDLLDKLLNSPRVESISINIEKVGDVEETHITANLKGLTLNKHNDETSGLFENGKYMND